MKRHGKQVLKTKPLYSEGQIVEKIEEAWTEKVNILECKWAGHCWYYRILNGGVTSWVLESQLRAPIGATA